MDSSDCLLLLLSISVFYFLVFLFYTIYLSFPCGRFRLTRVGFRAHVKTASRIVSYRIPCDVAIDVSSSGGQQYLQSALKVLVLLTGVDSVTEQLLEIFQRELVHRVDVGHVGHHEVESRAAYGHDTVAFARDRDHLLGRFGFLQTL